MEFGSDFHYIQDYRDDSAFFRHYSEARFYASGRHALEALYKQQQWKRIWVPDYFCYEVVTYLLSNGLNVVFYSDNPLMDRIGYDDLAFQKGDVLLRVNYFGLRAKRKNTNIPVPVVEDHTHDLVGQWAIHSDADWCIASLRKTIPVAMGGVLWSPKGKKLPGLVQPTDECVNISEVRYQAMKLKACYLKNGGDKEVFREKYINTEDDIDKLKLSGIDGDSYNIITDFNMKLWTDIKQDNWEIVKKKIGERYRILPYEDRVGVHPFSIIIIFDTNQNRERFRKYLIQNDIYPAILWRIPETASQESIDFGNRMISIHCDARYSSASIEKMCEIINQYD